MLGTDSSIPDIDPEVRAQWALSPIEFLGGRANQHWLVDSDGARFVLRAYSPEPLGEIGYELNALKRLKEIGWSVPVAVAEPMEAAGRTWCLFTRLPGRPMVDSPEEARIKGRLLAQLHESTAAISDIGQRKGAARSEEIVRDPELLAALQDYAFIRPDEASVLLWYLGETRRRFDAIELGGAELLVMQRLYALESPFRREPTFRRARLRGYPFELPGSRFCVVLAWLSRPGHSGLPGCAQAD